MGQGQSPTADELKYIYGLISQGYSDADIIKKYGELESHGNLGSLPYRTDIRFIRQRRKEFEVAKDLLKSQLVQESDPCLLEAKNKHMQELRETIEKWENLTIEPGLEEELLKTWLTELEVLHNELLFKSLKQHLPFKELWEKDELCMQNLILAKKYYQALHNEIEPNEEMKEVVSSFDKDFKKPILENVSNMRIGDKIVDYDFWIGDRSHKDKNLYAVACKGAVFNLENVNFFLCLTSDPKKFISLYKDLSNKILHGEIMEKFIETDRILCRESYDINDALQKILISRAYINANTSCDLCPGQPKIF